MGCFILCSHSKNIDPEKHSYIILNVNPNNSQNNNNDLNLGYTGYNDICKKNNNNNISNLPINHKVINNLDYSFTPANYPLMDMVYLKFK